MGDGTLYMCGETMYYDMWYTWSNNVQENYKQAGPNYYIRIANSLAQPICYSCPGKL